MKLTDEELMAYADGELPPAQAKRIEAAMAEDPQLAARVARFRAVRRALRTAYDSVVSEPVPEHLRALLGDVAASEPPMVIPPAATKRGGRFGGGVWAAIAVSLILGVLVGRTLLPSGSGALTSDGRHASAEVSRVLDSRLAGDVEGAATRVGLTFLTTQGEVCRTFSHHEAAHVTSGIACRVGDDWAVRMAVNDEAGKGAQNAGPDGPAVREAVAAIISGQPFNERQERAARDRRWQPQP